jgi:hypothetical protein
MHLTLKKEATRPAGANLLQQQAKFDAFVEEFNHERPHEALEMKYPAEIYTASSRPYRGIAEPQYPLHDKIVVVTNCGRLCLYRKKINLSTCLAGQAVGIKEVDDGIWSSALWLTISVTSTWRKNVAAPRQSIRAETVTYVSGMDKQNFGTPGRIRTYDLLLRRQTLYPG